MNKNKTIDCLLNLLSLDIINTDFEYNCLVIGRQMPWDNYYKEKKSVSFYAKRAFYHFIRKYIPSEHLEYAKKKNDEWADKPMIVIPSLLRMK